MNPVVGKCIKPITTDAMDSFAATLLEFGIRPVTVIVREGVGRDVRDGIWIISATVCPPQIANIRESARQFRCDASDNPMLAMQQINRPVDEPDAELHVDMPRTTAPRTAPAEQQAAPVFDLTLAQVPSNFRANVSAVRLNPEPIGESSRVRMPIRGKFAVSFS
ncbi:MAG TPA: hypothetical protein VFX49_01525 [Chloroflexota bacterium]|nr:hypothetical protein [Chloroflexota bacterium]